MHILEVRALFNKPSDERALLAFAFKDIDYFYDMSSKLDNEDFLSSEHQLFYGLFKTLVNDKKVTKLDLVLVINEAISQGVEDMLGGVDYIRTIHDLSYNLSKENYAIFLQAVLEASTKFKLHIMLDNSLRDVAANTKDSASLIGQVETQVLDLSTSSRAIKEPRNFADGLFDWIEEKRKNPVRITGLDTGFPILNSQIDGLIPGTLLVIAARKKMGKSAFLTQMGVHLAYRQCKSVLYVDTELPFEQWRSRVLSNISGIKERDILHGGFNDDTYKRLMRCEDIVKRGNLFHEYMPGYSVDKLVALYKKYKAKEDIAIGMFDYIKEPDSSTIDRQRKEYQVLGDVATKLKDLSGELSIPFVTAVQLNRDNDIADSDRIARYADVICQWGYRTEDELAEAPLDGGRYKLMIKDSRRGGGTPEVGISYKFFKDHITIKETPPDKQLFTNFTSMDNTYSSDKEEEGYVYDGYEGYEDEELR